MEKPPRRPQRPHQPPKAHTRGNLPRAATPGKPGVAAPGVRDHARVQPAGGGLHPRGGRGREERDPRTSFGRQEREDPRTPDRRRERGDDRVPDSRPQRDERRAAGGYDGRGQRAHEAPAGRDLIFGVEPVRELIAAAPGSIRVLYVKAGTEGRFATEIDAVRTQGASVIRSEDEALTRMAGSEARHQGLVAIMREYQYAPFEEVVAEAHDPLLVIDGVTDPRNLGAIMRSAECAGVGAIVIARDRTVGITPIVVKSSSGAWVHLRIARCGNVAQAIAALKEAGYWVVALAPSGDLSIYDLDTSRRLAFVLGSEGRGVRDIVKKSSDFIASIPMHGRIESLNVSVAAAVALFEVARRRTAPKA